MPRKTRRPKKLRKERKTVPIGSVVPHPQNKRIGDVEAIKKSIAANGMYVGLTVQKSTGHILVGNHRWKAARELGIEEVDCDFLDVDDAAALRILLVDNRTPELATWDTKGLTELLAEIALSSGLDGTGYDEAALDRLLAEISVPAFEPSDEESQSRLDEKAPVTCPECGCVFAP